MTKKEIREEIICAMKEMIIRCVKPLLKFDMTRRGKVISYSNNIAKVSIDDVEYNCRCKISVRAGDSVRVTVENNDYKHIRVEEVE